MKVFTFDGFGINDKNDPYKKRLATLTDAGKLEDVGRLLAAAPELLEALYKALPFVEDAEDDEAFKKGHVKKIVLEMKTAMQKAEGGPILPAFKVTTEDGKPFELTEKETEEIEQEIYQSN